MILSKSRIYELKLFKNGSVDKLVKEERDCYIRDVKHNFWSLGMYHATLKGYEKFIHFSDLKGASWNQCLCWSAAQHYMNLIQYFNFYTSRRLGFCL